MRVSKIIYERLVNTGNFSHETFGVEVVLNNEEKAQEAMDNAKKFVDRQVVKPSRVEREIAQKVSAFDDDDIPF